MRAITAIVLLAIPVAALAKNDFSVGSVSGPASAESGASIPILATISWGATSASTTDVRVAFYLSNDATITTGDILLGDTLVAIAPGQTVQVGYAATIPRTQPSGTYYLGAFVDSDNRIAETSETNNTRAGNLIAIAAAPDLSVTSVTGPPSATFGDTMELRATVSAAATGSRSASANLTFYLSADATITTADTYLTSVPVVLAPGQTTEYAGTYVVAGPLSPMTYHLGAIVDADNAVSEIDEGNNARAGPLVEILPDLEPPIITVSGVSNDAVVTETPLTICYTAADPNLLTDSGELDLLPFRGCTTVLTPGLHSLVIDASDLYGNSAHTALHFIIDGSPPTILVEAPANGDVVASSAIDVVVVATDDAGVSTVTANGVLLAASVDGRFRGVVPLPLEGGNVVQCVVTDVAGNAVDVSVTVIRDTTQPQLTVSSPAQNADVQSPVAVSGSVSDATMVTVKVGSVPIAVSANGIFTTAVEAALGPWDITVSAQDAAGNQASVSRHATVRQPGSFYCYDVAGNVTGRLTCLFGVDCAGRCP